MAKTPLNDDDASKKKRRGASVVVWILMAMLVGGLGGFGVTNFGTGTSYIGSVGEKKIEVNDYARALQQQIAALSQQFGQQLTFEQVQAFGLDQQVLQTVIDRAALDNEAERIGLSVGDAVVAEKLMQIPSFQSVAGGFDRAAYADTLKRNNLTEVGFESGIRADAAREILQTAITSGFATPDTLTDTVTAWAGETRGYSMLLLTEKALAAPVAALDDAALQAYYNDHIADYTRPEAKRIAYAALLPEDLAKDMPVDDAALKAEYDAHLSDYMIPEKRLVERLGFATDEDAAAAKARIDAGETFEALVAERNLTLNDVDLGDVSKSELGAAGEGVFALTGPGIVGPLPSSVGPALFRMNAVLSAQETTFEQAKPDLGKEVQLAAARKAIADKVEAVDDALAGGATIADMAKEQGLVLGTTDYAAGTDDNEAIAGYQAFRDAADKVAAGDFPEAILLDDGGLVVIEFKEIVPSAPRPFDVVKDKVATDARAAAVAKALADEAIRVKAGVEAGAALGSFGIVDHQAKIDRQGAIKDAPDTVLSALFEMAAGDLRIIEAPGFTAVVQLDSIAAVDIASEDTQAIRDAVKVNAAKAISDDVLTLYTNALTAEAGISLNQSVINSVNTQAGN